MVAHQCYALNTCHGRPHAVTPPPVSPRQTAKSLRAERQDEMYRDLRALLKLLTHLTQRDLVDFGSDSACGQAAAVDVAEVRAVMHEGDGAGWVLRQAVWLQRDACMLNSPLNIKRNVQAMP